jgi:YfiH family protein
MNKNQSGEIVYFTFPHLSGQDSCLHFVSTRLGGYSQAHLQRLNLSLNVQDDTESVIKNRVALAKAVGFSPDSYCFANQVHSPNISLISNQDRGRGMYDYQDCIKATDALITKEKNICLIALGADCVPILFFDPQKKVIAAAHAGWRGTVQKIAALTAQRMKNEFNCHYENILVCIGPCISAKNYEIGTEVENAVKEAFGAEDKYLIMNELTNRKHFDLVYANTQQLIDLGLQAKNIIASGFCTFDNSDLFFSSRKDSGKTGRFGAGIMLV